MSLSENEVRALGLGSVGKNVVIHETAQFFGASNISIGDNVRIDCFVVITAGPGEVRIGRNVHLAAAVHLFGGGGIRVDDFGNLSGRVSIYSTNDDYTRGSLTNPTVPEHLREVTMKPVVLGRHAIVGCGSVILPGVTVGFGAAVGALTKVSRDVADCAVIVGNPNRVVAERDGSRLRALEEEYLASEGLKGRPRSDV